MASTLAKKIYKERLKKQLLFPSVCLYLQIHQPFRITGEKVNYFKDRKKNEISNKKIFEKVCRKSYLPAGKILLRILKKHKDFHFSISFSGLALEQMEKFSPEVLTVFQKIHKTGRMEILSETYHHSLAFFYSKREFEKQVSMHRQKIKKLFNADPKVFRNTELAYNNDLAVWAEKKGYAGILAEGWEEYIGSCGPNYVYQPKDTEKIRLLLRNYKFSDDIAFRFSEPSWPGWPLDASKFANCLGKDGGETINIFLDFETFGEHQYQETGIFNFLTDLPIEILKRNGKFRTASQTISFFKPKAKIDVPKILTWADSERDLSAWNGNKRQKDALRVVYGLEKNISSVKNRNVVKDWRRLQTSDHFYYMSTKGLDDGGIHDYFSPHKNPQKAYKIFIKTIKNLALRIKKKNSS